VRGGAAGEIRSRRCLTQKAYGFPRSKASFTEFPPPLVRTKSEQEFLFLCRKKRFLNVNSKEEAGRFVLLVKMEAEGENSVKDAFEPKNV